MWILDLLAVLFGIVQWLIPDPNIKKKLQLYSTQTKPARDFIKNISEFLLSPKVSTSIIVTNTDAIKNEQYIIRHRHIYWPVTPTNAPNIIHAVFIHYIRLLSDLGFTTVVFVFDHYYSLLKQATKSEAVCRSEVESFIHSMKLMGLPDTCKIVYESKFFKSKKLARNLIISILQTYSELTIADLIEINSSKTYLNKAGETKFIRYSKSVYNMVYLSAIKYKFGLTLAGEDEKVIWDVYANSSEHRHQNLTNLFIPKMKSLESGDTDVLDSTRNITINDTIEEISDKICATITTLNTQGESALMYLLNHIYFFQKKPLIVKVARREKFTSYANVNQLAQDIISKKIDINDLAKQIYNLFHVSVAHTREVN